MRRYNRCRCRGTSPSRQQASREISAASAPSTESTSRCPPGSFYGFLGPNGAGKSTTIKCLTGLLRPTAGTMTILGIDPLADSVSVKRRIGVVPEDLALFDRLTAEETLDVRRPGPRDRAATAKHRSSDLLERHGSEKRRDDARDRLFPWHAQEAIARRRAPARAETALPRRTVRGHRCRRLTSDQGSAAVVRRSRRHDLFDVSHSRDRRTALDAHRRDRARQDGGAGADRRASFRRWRRKSLEELFIGLVGGEAKSHDLDWI